MKSLQQYRHLPYPRNLYAAFLSTMDERVGQLLKFLQDAGLEIIRLSFINRTTAISNAPISEEEAVAPTAVRNSAFLKVASACPPSSPGPVISEGEVRNQLADGCDWLPTLAELCGVESAKANLNGRSLAAVIRSAAAPSPHELLHWRLGKQWAVREGPWKLLHNPDDTADKEKLSASDKEWFLANIDNDPGERINLAAKHPELVQRLRKLAPEGPD